MAQATRGRTRKAKLESLNPATGEVVRTYEPSTPAEVKQAVERARKVQPEWAALGPRGRADLLRAVRTRIYERMDEIVDVVATENGKPRVEALSHDVLPTVLTLTYLCAITPKTLRPDRVSPLIGAAVGMSSKIEFRPFGVVGCITPWNYPLYLAFQAFTPALLAGNTVVIKPSEITPAIGELIRELLEPLPSDVATVVQGAGEVGAALVAAPCDKICFIGSGGTGRKIAEAAAKHLTPVVMELGGQDTALVCEDADLDVASSGVLWGAFLNAGQTCCAIERTYVVDSVADEFERLLVDKLKQVQAGDENMIGPLTATRQLEVVERHVKDAVEKGAKVLAGGPDGERRDGGLWFAPTILEGRSEDMAIFREETFGPVLPIVRVKDEDEAVRRANEEGFNLTASVWTRSSKKGQEIASRVKAGTVMINDHATAAGLPWGLWGGVGESGYGRLQGALGLREFTVPVHVGRRTIPGLKQPWWYPYDRATTDTLRAAAEVLSAPRLDQKVAAAKTFLVNVGRSIKNKI
ncbi:MAG TPA: aldehyde dehydrogenase family protein [Actinomycetota bacterium]|nr:aldehyde dehydrogenase family protein [Actinomycetota bacterium]